MPHSYGVILAIWAGRLPLFAGLEKPEVWNVLSKMFAQDEYIRLIV